MNKTKIFVSAYACEPGLGSEIGVGWHWVLEMSQYYELWVLTRRSNQNNIESWMSRQDKQYNIHFVYFDLPKALRFWKKGLRGVRTYYTIWQKLTNKIVKKTMEENDIKIYHLLTYGNALWPASSYGMKQFFIWGPTGGVDTIPAEYSKFYDLKSRLMESVRRNIVRTLPFNRGFNKRCKNADLILCKSYNMYNAVPKAYRNKAQLFTDVAAERKTINAVQDREQNKYIKYIVVGKLDAWRAFDILVEAFARAYRENDKIRLSILGDGNDKRRIQKLIKNLKMEDAISMLGNVSMDNYYHIIANCDVVVNSSLKEGAVTVSFDSMALAKPLVCVDTGGYTRYFSHENAIVIKRGKRNKLIDDMKDAILKMTKKELRDIIGGKSKQLAENYTWYHKGEEIHQVIDKAYSNVNIFGKE